MANSFRWRYGETVPVMAAVDSSTVIDIGDLVYLDTDDAKPASSQTDQGDEASNQETFHDGFLGVAMQASADGETDPIRVATRGVFEFVCPSGTWEIGDFIGVDEAVSGTALEDQQVAAVPAENRAIGRCARRAATSATNVYVAIESAVMHGGVQAVV